MTPQLLAEFTLLLFHRQVTVFHPRLVKILDRPPGEKPFPARSLVPHKAFGNPAPNPRASDSRQAKVATCPFQDRMVQAFISAMPWKRLLAYITGSVDQELLVRNEYHVERPHQGKGNVILFPEEDANTARAGPFQCRERLGGLLWFNYRSAG